MSEYQYYEFLAIDEPLDAEAIQKLRQISSRAEIGPTRFVNHYDFGDFRGDPNALMERHFDLFLYLANWGVRTVMLRLPRTLLDQDEAVRYDAGENAGIRQTARHAILFFETNDEDRDLDDYSDGRDVLPVLAPLRSELMRGDMRALYLGWLLGVQFGGVEEDEAEPPRPDGLDFLSPALDALADFLRLDRDLLAIAAEPGGEVESRTLSHAEIETHVRNLPEEEKTALLMRVVAEEERHVGLELRRGFRNAKPGSGQLPPPGGRQRRTAADLLAAAERHAEMRRQAAAARAAAERAGRLDALAAREPQAWQEVGSLIASRSAGGYDAAVRLLVDLRDLSIRLGRQDEFARTVAELRQMHARKGRFLASLDAALLPA